MLWVLKTHRHAAMLWVLQHTHQHDVMMFVMLTDDTCYHQCESDNLPHPNEDIVGRSDKHFRVRFRSTFQGCVAQMKSASKTYSERLVQPSKFTPPKRPCSQTKILEGWTTDEMRMFETLFLLLVAHMKYSHPWKVLRKSAFHLLFILPKSSFGMGKILRLGSMKFLRFTRGW
jgi:hypothetical protein